MAERKVAGTYVFEAKNPVERTQAAKAAAKLLRQGKLVAFPTETVYGLGANAWDKAAVEKIFFAKGRPADNPLIVHISQPEQLEALASPIPDAAWLLAEHFWPGPLTLVLPKKPQVPDVVTGGLATVAVRLPKHPVALALLEAADLPVAAPSANLSGRPSPTTAEHVLTDLAGRIDAVVDGGPCEVGLESTVLNLSGETLQILRPGAVTAEEISEVLGEKCAVAHWQEESGAKPPSPGLKYLHYAPQAPLYLLRGDPKSIVKALQERQQKWEAAGKKTGLLVSAETAPFFASEYLLVLGSRTDPAGMAARLYDALRRFDHMGVDVILAEGYPATGVGLALMNRLQKAAGGRVIDLE
ncbi:MAG: threonylcarbamoyl-AMP synthase [Firmicutes bacterium]|nr:threonylcarbamoyl-AMP synthase [Bacillota bacterium]